MKKIYFKLSQNARDFMSFCTKNDIQYNLPKGKGFDKVLVEYQAYHGIKTSIAEVNAISGDDSMNWQGRNDLRDYKIKVSPDNTITIKPIQEEKTSWSREEVIQLAEKCLNHFKPMNAWDDEEALNFIKENL